MDEILNRAYDDAGVLKLGVDIGSKTIKLVIIDNNGEMLYESYDRHLSNVKDTLLYTLKKAMRMFPNREIVVGVTGSAGMQFADMLGLEFIQEVVACRNAIKRYIPETDVAIEIGGEDSKILFLTGGEELRMNSTCAGGTGGFIDTIAGMLDINAEKLNYYATGCRTIHPIASRCAVFAQTDVRPLLNQGVSKEDISGSVLDAVAVQCISGLACGRTIRGTVAFLGGPLHFLSSLRDRFKERLSLDDAHTIVPIYGHLFVALGAAISSNDTCVTTFEQLYARLNGINWSQDFTLERMPPLFENEGEYKEFTRRHAKAVVQRANIAGYEGLAYLGVDSGSEAIKYVLLSDDGRVLRTYYKRSAGNLIEVAREMLIDLWRHIPRMHDGTPAVYIAHATVTGYGESYLKKAFCFDSGEVETVAHMEAAKAFEPDVDFILDIGGQDVKCLYLRNGQLDNVVLNEACSSGCGALLSGMAWSMNVKLEKFLKEAIYAKRPVDLGSRCTVFMTSRVRHAQKAGACLGDISAGLAYSVVRNAIFKVIRVNDFSMLGNKIIVQGGTFLNDAVLRAFEKLSGLEVIRPDISGHMGAYGAALLARQRARTGVYSSLLKSQDVKRLKFSRSTRNCDICSNRCALTSTTFFSREGEHTYTVGNRCAKGAPELSRQENHMPNLFKYRMHRVFSVPKRSFGGRGYIGILRALDMYEYFPFWETFFSELGFNVVLSDIEQTSTICGSALETVPSESVCYPAKLAHAHVVNLVEKGVKTIFAPIIKGSAENGLTCPVTAGYPFVLNTNIPLLKECGVHLVSPEMDINACFDADGSIGLFAAQNAEIFTAIKSLDSSVNEAEVYRALRLAITAQKSFKNDMVYAGVVAFSKMCDAGGSGIVLTGRPYHTDPALNHAIPVLLESFGYAIFTDDSLDGIPNNQDKNGAKYALKSMAKDAYTEHILRSETEGFANWKFANRVLRAAKKTVLFDNLDLVELTSFGCGIDASTVDRAREIVEEAGKVFTVLKIDEMVDLASTRIRIRSMIAAQKNRRTSAKIIPAVRST